MTIYYARPISLYGTPQDQRDIATLESLGLVVVDPKGPEHQEAYAARGMDYFREMVDGCDAIAFRAFADGTVGAGVAAEIERAQEAGKPVIELPTALLRRVRSVEETREFLRECGHR